MKFSLIKSGSILLASVVLIAGCVPYPAQQVEPSTSVSGSPASSTPAETGKRLYTKDIVPIMKTCSSTSCHSAIALGKKYDTDKGIALASRKYMIGGTPDLTEDQKKVLNEWIAADTPNDPKTF